MIRTLSESPISAQLKFEKAIVTEKTRMVAEDKTLYIIHPARKQLR